MYEGTHVGDVRVAGKHLTMYYPKDTKLSEDQAALLKAQVEQHFGPVARAVRKQGVINGKVRAIEFYFKQD